MGWNVWRTSRPASTLFLKRYDQALSERPMLVVFTKQDITEVREQTEELRPFFENRGFRTLAISAVSKVMSG